MRTIALTFMVSAICCLSLVAQQPPGGLEALAQSGIEGPVVVVDLVKFMPDGAARYAIYDQIAEAKVEDLGGEVIFRGDAAQVPGRLPSSEWDRVTFRKYPPALLLLPVGPTTSRGQGGIPP